MQELVKKVRRRLEEHGLRLVTAESCTGGMIATALTDLKGASTYFERGFVTYSNEAKKELLGVPSSVLQKHGAVSAETAHAMVKGALKNSHGHIALSVTGIAGPDGGTKTKPVGLVYIGWGKKGRKDIYTVAHKFKGKRHDIRRQTTEAALKHILEYLDTLE